MIEITNILDVEKFIGHVDAVVFDLDDTLYSEKEYVRSGFTAVADFFSDSTMIDDLWHEFEAGKKAIDVVLDERGIIDRKEEALRIYRTHFPNIRLYSGVREMLERIYKTKKIGIITDGRSEGQRVKIEALNLKSIVNEIIITDELGGLEYQKPNKIPFELMQNKLNTPYERMAYVGDNIAKDFLAPEKLGMYSIHFNNSDGLY